MPTARCTTSIPQELLAQCLRALAARVGFDPVEVDDVIAGNGILTGDHDAVGRLATLLAGWPETVPGMTLNRFCGSAQQAITVAAMGVASGLPGPRGRGRRRVDVRAGTSRPDRSPSTAGTPTSAPAFPTVPQGISADLIATLEDFGRADVDTFAVESQRRAEVALTEGRFDRGIVAVTVRDGRGPPRRATSTLAPARRSRAWRSCAPRSPRWAPPTTTMALERYPQVDHIDHVHHAGNSSGVVDGAAAAVVASDAWVDANGVTPRARIRADRGRRLGAGDHADRARSRRGALPGQGGDEDGDIDLWEINEAFAAVPLKTMRDLGLDPERVNVNGGAIALGHPIGATGAMLIGTLLDELERQDLTTGLVTMCTGGGMGTATVIERV